MNKKVIIDLTGLIPTTAELTNTSCQRSNS